MHFTLIDTRRIPETSSLADTKSLVAAIIAGKGLMEPRANMMVHQHAAMRPAEMHQPMPHSMMHRSKTLTGLVMSKYVFGFFIGSYNAFYS